MKGCRLYARVLQTDNHVESTFLLIIIIIIIIINIIKIIINIIIINISLIKCLLGQKILFIFNPCISQQLISPCANFFFFF